jgi:hypothetical protein
MGRNFPAYLRSQTRLIVALAILVPLGFGSKFYAGPGAVWVNNSLGGVLYVIFWTFLAALVFPAARAILLAGGVLVVTCVLEYLQLWHPPFLEAVRSTFIGRTLIGNSFSRADLLYYLAGSVISVYLLAWLRSSGRK